MTDEPTADLGALLDRARAAYRQLVPAVDGVTNLDAWRPAWRERGGQQLVDAVDQLAGVVAELQDALGVIEGAAKGTRATERGRILREVVGPRLGEELRAGPDLGEPELLEAFVLDDQPLGSRDLVGIEESSSSEDRSLPPKVQAFEEFIESVAGGLVDAQRQLDRTSLRFASQRDPRIPPTHYAIPSVQAELKVGLQSVDERKLSLVLINNAQRKKEYAEASLSFEVVAAPPPPEAVRQLAPPFLVVGGDVSVLLRAAGTRAGVFGPTGWKGSHAAYLDRALVFADHGAPTRWTVLLLSGVGGTTRPHSLMEVGLRGQLEVGPDGAVRLVPQGQPPAPVDQPLDDNRWALLSPIFDAVRAWREAVRLSTASG